MMTQPVGYAYCVPTVLQDVLARHGIEATLADVVQGCKSHKSRGTLLKDTKPFLASHGLTYRRFRFTFDGIMEQLDSNNPIVAAYSDSADSSHFTSIIHISREAQIEWVVLSDPLYGKIAFALDTFKILWGLDESWARVVVKL